MLAKGELHSHGFIPFPGKVFNVNNKYVENVSTISGRHCSMICLYQESCFGISREKGTSSKTNGQLCQLIMTLQPQIDATTSNNGQLIYIKGITCFNPCLI